jgi:hypothetical protein
MTQWTWVVLVALAAGCGGGSSESPDADADVAPDADVPDVPEVVEDVPNFAEARFFVSPTGDDDAPGTIDEPFATLGRARDAVRELRASGGIPEDGAVVALRGGTYPVPEPIVFTADDSGEADAPTWYGAYPGEEPRLSAGAALDPARFVPVPADDPIRERLPEAVRDDVRVADLAAAGIADVGTLARRGFSTYDVAAPLEPFIPRADLGREPEPRTLARWPNAGHTDTEDRTVDAIVSGDRFGDGVVFRYLGTEATGSADDGLENYSAAHGGTTWFLYHCTWEWGGATHRYWFLNESDPRVSAECWPDDRTGWLASGTWPIPVLEPFGGDSTEDVVPRTRPDDFAEHGFLRIPETYAADSFRFPGDRFRAWAHPERIHVQGLLGQLWADDTLGGRVEPDGTVVLDEAPSYDARRFHPFFVLDVPEELDSWGAEYWLDRERARLYLLPPAGLVDGPVAVSVHEGPIVSLRGTAHVRFHGLTFELSRRGLARGEELDDVVFARCAFLNNGADAVRLSGTSSGLERCRIAGAGGRGVSLAGGHRGDLTPAGNFVRDCVIEATSRWDRTYKPPVSLSGVGQIVEHNRIERVPHAAILFTGNDHRIEYNRIHGVVLEANDAGAIYTGRDWGYRGTRIAFNHISTVRSVFGGAHAVYLDDAASGIEVFGNVIHGVTGWATLSGGGRDNRFENNVIFDAEGAHVTDRRARAVANDEVRPDGCPDDWNLLGRLHTDYATCGSLRAQPIAYRSPPWSTRYPAVAAIPDDWSAIAGTHWLDPEGCVFARNVIWRTDAALFESTWGGDGALDSYAETEPNLIGVDPLFVDESSGDLTLRPDSPAFDLPGFAAVPFAEIGVRE